MLILKLNIILKPDVSFNYSFRPVSLLTISYVKKLKMGVSFWVFFNINVEYIVKVTTAI